ncbi:hypothetical protein [Candidatus Solirubrobacter pratensis]|uniref:hypothetical protein n=1 Tax=Candidatus Solirubrobacter pratensis TaxID=1298857 RepID=UPI0004081960|nr:hypothetical protein [Candidatus Solirubrobacter pratensis]
MPDTDDEELEPAAQVDESDAAAHGEPDVLLDVSDLRVDEISLEVEDLRAQVSLQADVLQLLKLHVGVEAELGRVQLTIKGVEAKVLLKARLDNVARIIDRVMSTIDHNPDMVRELLERVGETVEEVGTRAGESVGDLGRGAGAIAEGAGEGAGRIAEGAGRVVKDAGEAVGDAAEDARRPRPVERAPEAPRRRRADGSGTRPAKGSRTSRGRRSEGG